MDLNRECCKRSMQQQFGVLETREPVLRRPVQGLQDTYSLVVSSPAIKEHRDPLRLP
jgi:hypothetical protein